MEKKRCRHERNSWIIGSGARYEWCYVCGAFRKLDSEKEGVFYATSKWIKPTGDRDNNPYHELHDQI